MFDALRRMREAGWRVAVHNDYTLNGEFHTFWLFTHPSDRFVKGEGRSDEEALARAEAATAKWVGLSPALRRTVPDDDRSRWMRCGPETWHLFKRLPMKHGETCAYAFQSMCQKAFMTEAAAAEAWTGNAVGALAAMLDHKNCRECLKAGDAEEVSA